MPKKTTLPATTNLPIPSQLIEAKIYLIRGLKVMLDSDLAELYQVETRALVQAARRNPGRFPEDFMFQLSPEESETMRSQFVIASRRNIRYYPYAFTEHGVAMLSSVLKSDRAVQMNIIIIRAFVKLREVLATHKELARKIDQLSATQKDHAALFTIVIKDIESLTKGVRTELKRLQSPRRRKARIGFMSE